MKISREFLDCVAFLCVSRNSKHVPSGTAFFVELQDESEASRHWVYVVTARHCIEETTDQTIFVRINTVPDVQSKFGFQDIPTRKEDWFKHDDADVAAILSPHNPERHNIQKLTLDLFVDRHYRLDTKVLAGRGNRRLEGLLQTNFQNGIEVELGDDLVFPGLFVQSAGKNQNLPVARFGNVSRMPSDEMIVFPTKARGDVSVRAYLAEAHSWGGHSGSPVLWHRFLNISEPFAVTPELQQSVMTGRMFVMALLGLVSGHFNIASEVTKTPRNERLNFTANLNSGVAIITPAENIRELLMREDLIEDRRKRAAKDREPVATADFDGGGDNEQLTLAPNPKDRIKIPILTREQFAHDLKKATRKRDKK